MRAELRRKIIEYNRAAAKNREMAQDLAYLLAALPPGQVKNLCKEPACAEILQKYGLGKENG